jgi:hypothetical protein
LYLHETIITSNDTLTKICGKFQSREKVIKNCEQKLAKNIENRKISGEYYFIFHFSSNIE